MNDAVTQPEKAEGQALPQESETDANLNPDSSQGQAEVAENHETSPKDDDKSKDTPQWVQKRFNEMTRAKYAAIQEKQESERKLQELQQKLDQYENREPVEPKYEDFDSDQDYANAMKEYGKALGKMEVRKQQPQQRDDGPDPLKESVQKVQSAIASATYIPELKDIVQDPNLPIDDLTIEYLADSDKAPEVVYYLGTHLDKAFEISNMSPAQKIRELSKLEKTLEKPQPKTLSDAPEPPEPIGGSSGTMKADADLSVEEYIARRNAKLHGG
jgi:hypothetical protein